MKFLVTSDWHLDAVTMGVRRFPELEAAVHQTVQTALDARVDAYIFNGDLCDPDSGTSVFRCVALAQEAAMRLKIMGIRSYWLVGNHDVIEDGSGDSTLTPLRTLGSGVEVLAGPAVLHLWKDHRFITLPFTAASHAYEPARFVRTVMEQPTASSKTVTVVLSHLSVPGIIPGEETTEMPRGREVTLPLEELTDKNTLVIQGHYHRRQTFKPKVGPTVHVVGSLARLTHGEEKHDPGFLIVDTEAVHAA